MTGAIVRNDKRAEEDAAVAVDLKAAESPLADELDVKLLRGGQRRVVAAAADTAALLAADDWQLGSGSTGKVHAAGRLLVVLTSDCGDLGDKAEAAEHPHKVVDELAGRLLKRELTLANRAVGVDQACDDSAADRDGVFAEVGGDALAAAAEHAKLLELG